MVPLKLSSNAIKSLSISNIFYWPPVLTFHSHHSHPFPKHPWIRTLGYGSGSESVSCSFRQWLSRCQQKNKFFCLLISVCMVYLHRVSLRSHITVESISFAVVLLVTFTLFLAHFPKPSAFLAAISLFLNHHFFPPFLIFDILFPLLKPSVLLAAGSSCIGHHFSP